MHEVFEVDVAVVVVVVVAAAVFEPPPQLSMAPAPVTAKMPIAWRRLISLFLFSGDNRFSGQRSVRSLPICDRSQSRAPVCFSSLASFDGRRISQEAYNSGDFQ